MPCTYNHAIGKPRSALESSNIVSIVIFSPLHIATTGIAPIGQGLHFISKNEKNKTSKFAIENEGGILADPGAI